MSSTNTISPLVVILGPTASGKSALAIELAEKFDGEIIAADSRTVYKGMNIGTAKPSPDDQKRVRHHLLDVVAPDRPYTVADFQQQAFAAINDIASRGKLPFLVGGSGLYIDSVIYNFSFRAPAGASMREQLQRLSVDALQQMLEGQGIPLPENQRNPRHLIRALETGGQSPQRAALRPNTLVLGITKERDELRMAIQQRVDRMVENGFIDEVKTLSLRYGWDVPALQAPGYRAFRGFLAGACTIDEAKQQFVQYDLQYAKRQMTWFKRNKDIVWISRTEQSVDLVTTFLNK